MTETPPSIAVWSRIRYYDVQGATAAELGRSIEARGPRHEGASWAGFTASPISWRFTSARGPEGCTVDRLWVRLDVVTTLPRWTAAPQASPALRAQWDAYAAALAHHERGHAELARAEADRLADSLTAVGPVPCAGIQAALSAVAARQAAHHAQVHRDYDARTRHGITQGAVRPVDPAPPRAAGAPVPWALLLALLAGLWIARSLIRR